MNLILSKRLFRFIVIGGSAFCVHWLTVFLIVNFLGMHPLKANIIGFLCAFGVSYTGHKNWTFEARGHAHSKALMKFFTVAIIGFLVNQGVYALLLNILHLHYLIGLTIALIIAAVSTYILSQFWAFKK